MKNTDIFKLSSTFSKREAKQCAAYLSNFTDAKPQILQLWDIIYDAYKNKKYNWGKLDLSKEEINQKLLGKTEDNSKARSIRSILYKNLKNYAAFLQFQEEREKDKQYLFRYSAKRNIGSLSEGEYKRIVKDLNKKIGINCLEQNYKASKTYIDTLILDQRKKALPDYKAHFASFSNYALMQQIQLYCIMLNHALIAHSPLDQDFEQKMVQIFDQASDVESLQKIVHLYKVCSLMLKNDVAQYKVLKELVKQHDGVIDVSDKKFLYIFMHTFCTICQDRDLIHEARLIYLKRFEEHLLHEGDIIPLMHAKGLCTTILKMTQIEDLTARWSKEQAEAKIKEVVKEMPRQYRKANEQFHMGVLAFYFKEYHTAIEILNKKIVYPNAFFDFDARSVLIRAYYLLGNADDFFSKQIRAFQEALRYDESISQDHKNGYKNFIRAIRSLDKARNLSLEYQGNLKATNTLSELEHFLDKNPVKVVGWIIKEMENLGYCFKHKELLSQ